MTMGDRSNSRIEGRGDPLKGGLTVCAILTVASVFAILDGEDRGKNLPGYLGLAFFWFVGLCLVGHGLMVRGKLRALARVKNFFLKLIVLAFGLVIGGFGWGMLTVTPYRELVVRHRGWSLGLIASMAFGLPFALGGALCLWSGIRGLFTSRRTAFGDQLTAKSFVGVDLKRKMALPEVNAMFFVAVWWGFVLIAGFVLLASFRSGWHLLFLAPFVAVGVCLLVRLPKRIGSHVRGLHYRARLTSAALYPGAEARIEYAPLGDTAGVGSLQVMVSQLDMSVREARKDEPMDVDADRSVRKVVANGLEPRGGSFAFRLPKALYDEAIRWELILRFRDSRGVDVEDHFKLPLK